MNRAFSIVDFEVQRSLSETQRKERLVAFIQIAVHVSMALQS